MPLLGRCAACAGRSELGAFRAFASGFSPGFKENDWNRGATAAKTEKKMVARLRLKVA